MTLGGFTEDGDKGSQLTVIQLEDGRSFRTRPRNVGGERDFNRLDLPPFAPDVLEKAIGPFEDQVARVIREMDRTGEFPESQDDYAALMLFITMIHVRNAANRRRLQKVNTMMLRQLGNQAIETRETWDQTVAAAKRDGVKIPDDYTYEQFKEFVEEERYEITFRAGYHALLEYQLLPELNAWVWKRNWTLYQSSPETGLFVSSDSPAVVSDLNSGVLGVGLGTPNTQLIVPLSKNIAIRGVLVETPNRSVAADPSIVASINGCTVRGAIEQVFAANVHFQFEVEGEIRLGDSLLR